VRRLPLPVRPTRKREGVDRAWSVDRGRNRPRRRPPLRSQRAGLPHGAPASGTGGEADFGIGMQDSGHWQPLARQLQAVLDLAQLRPHRDPLELQLSGRRLPADGGIRRLGAACAGRRARRSAPPGQRCGGGSFAPTWPGLPPRRPPRRQVGQRPRSASPPVPAPGTCRGLLGVAMESVRGQGRRPHPGYPQAGSDGAADSEEGAPIHLV
jgi:hypothetical protein